MKEIKRFEKLKYELNEKEQAVYEKLAKVFEEVKPVEAPILKKIVEDYFPLSSDDNGIRLQLPTINSDNSVSVSIKFGKLVDVLRIPVYESEMFCWDMYAIHRKLQEKLKKQKEDGFTTTVAEDKKETIAEPIIENKSQDEEYVLEVGLRLIVDEDALSQEDYERVTAARITFGGWLCTKGLGIAEGRDTYLKGGSGVTYYYYCLNDKLEEIKLKLNSILKNFNVAEFIEIKESDYIIENQVDKYYLEARKSYSVRYSKK